MKHKFKLVIIAIVFVMPLIMAGLAVAEDANNDTNSGQTDTSNIDRDKLRERLEARKNKLTEHLSDIKRLRITNRCKAAQNKLTNISNRIKDVESSRNDVYTRLLDSLTKLSNLLKNKQIDTVQLDGQIEELRDMTEAFKENLASYKQALIDLSVMDCEADPEAFQASLEEARTLRQQLHQKSLDIRTYLSETIKPELQNLRSQLAAGNENNAEAQ